MAQSDREKSWTRDDQQKPGSPPRPAAEPKGSQDSSRSAKTQADPATGAPQKGAPAPNQSDGDTDA